MVEVHERGTCVGDHWRAGGAGRLLSGNCESGDVELPEALRRVDVDVVEVAVIFGVVNVTKFVCSLAAAVLEVGREERLGEVWDEVLPEGLLRLWLDGVDGGEGQAEQTVHVLVGFELVRNLGGELDGLLVDCRAAHVNGVIADNAAGTAAVLLSLSVPSRYLW